MTQEELAKKVGYTSRTSINKVERGLVDLSQSKILDFAKALNTTPAFLLGLEDNNLYQDFNESKFDWQLLNTDKDKNNLIEKSYIAQYQGGIFYKFEYYDNDKIINEFVVSEEEDLLQQYRILNKMKSSNEYKLFSESEKKIVENMLNSVIRSIKGYRK